MRFSPPITTDDDERGEEALPPAPDQESAAMLSKTSSPLSPRLMIPVVAHSKVYIKRMLQRILPVKTKATSGQSLVRFAVVPPLFFLKFGLVLKSVKSAAIGGQCSQGSETPADTKTKAY